MRKQKNNALSIYLQIASIVLVLGVSIFTNIFLFNKIEETNQKIRTLTNKLDEEATKIKDSEIEIKESIKTSTEEINKNINNRFDSLSSIVVTKSSFNSFVNSVNEKFNNVDSCIVNLNTVLNSINSNIDNKADTSLVNDLYDEVVEIKSLLNDPTE